MYAYQYHSLQLHFQAPQEGKVEPNPGRHLTMLHKAPAWYVNHLCLWLQEIKILQLRQRGKAQKFFYALVWYLPITLANLPVKPGDPNITPAAASDPLDVGNSQTKGSGKADHRMQLCMCCTVTHPGCELRESSPRFEHANSLLHPTARVRSRQEWLHFWVSHETRTSKSHWKKPTPCEIFAGRQRKSTNICELNVYQTCKLKSYYRLRAQSGETYMHRQMQHWWHESDRSATMFTKLSMANNSAPFVGFDRRNSAGSNDSWFAWDNPSWLCQSSFWTGLATVFITS